MVECVSDQDQSRAKWTTFSTKIFADLLVEQIRKGNRGSGAFSKLAWKIIRDEFNKQTGLNFDKQQLKNHLDVLRKRYNSVKAILNHTGFSWDVDQYTVLADDGVWQEYIEAHPEADIIRKRGCDIYEQLCIIFSSDSGINEKHAIAVSGTASHQTNEEQSRAKWTMPLEKVFADLMLEQAAQGNRLNNAFSNKAWKYIHHEFNRQTGLNYDKQQLKNHHGVLRRSYHSVKSLLDQDGFSWDKSRCMVIAESDVWANYIEKHPEIEAIRVKGCPLYEQLDSIFSEPGSAGNCAVPQVPQPQIAAFQMDTLPGEDQSKQDQSRAKWTVALDKILLNLLMEQTRQNKMSNKKAWKHIQNEFNYRTGLTFDGEQLRNHQNVLRRVYNNIKTVLDQGCFSWDDSRHVVVADDEVWEKYIMAHPEAETVRNKECLIFKDLCTLFSDPRAEGRYVQSSHDVKLDQQKVEMDDTPETASVSAEPAVDEASSRLSEEVNMSSGRNKRRSLIQPLISSTHQRRRVCRETSQTGVNDVSRHEEGNKTAAAAVVAAQSGDRFSISSCIEVLNEMGGVDQEVYLAALDLFQDPDRRETFVCIKSDIKLAWLKAKCKSLV
ncbi:L10-interacting MYB domain-containing protein [Rosa sericea]